MSFPNVYVHRKVAEGAARGCELCFKPTSSVLITAENKDFFYICPSHLKERGYCTPIVDKAAEEAKKKKKQEEERERQLQEEVERVKREYEEKKSKKDKKDKDKDADKDKKDKKDGKDDKSQDEEKDAAGDDKSEKKSTDVSEEQPRVFALQKFVYQQRLEKKRQIEIARRNQERMANPDFFPSVPKAAP